jgi:hypothetical protein
MWPLLITWKLWWSTKMTYGRAWLEPSGAYADIRVLNRKGDQRSSKPLVKNLGFRQGCPRSRDSSVCTVSDHGQDDRAIAVRSPEEARNFSSGLLSGPALGSIHCLPGVLSPRVKCSWGVTQTTHSHLVPRSRMSRSYNSYLPKRLHGV